MGTNFDEEDEADQGPEETEGEALRAQASLMTAYGGGVRALVLLPPEELPARAEALAASLDQLSAQLLAQATLLDRQTIAALRRKRR